MMARDTASARLAADTRTRLRAAPSRLSGTARYATVLSVTVATMMEPATMSSNRAVSDSDLGALRDMGVFSGIGCSGVTAQSRTCQAGAVVFDRSHPCTILHVTPNSTITPNR